MAGASAKKTAKNAAVKSTYYSIVAVAASVIHFVFTVASAGVSVSAIMWSLLLAGVALLSFKMIRSALELGVGYDMWQDLFIVNAIVQLGSCWSAYVWLVYLVVPGYAVYMLGGKVLGWVFAPSSPSAAPPKEKPKRR